MRTVRNPLSGNADIVTAGCLAAALNYEMSGAFTVDLCGSMETEDAADAVKIRL